MKTLISLWVFMFSSAAYAYAPILFFDTSFLLFVFKQVPLYGGLTMLGFESLVVWLLLRPHDFNQAVASLSFAIAATMLFAIILSMVLFFVLGETLLKSETPVWLTYVTIIYFAGVACYMGHIAKCKMLKNVRFSEVRSYRQVVLPMNIISFAVLYASVAGILFI